MIPPCSESELEELRADIEKNGLLEPIVLFEGKILDGRNRATACLMLGVKPETVEFEGESALDFVVSKNKVRRHLGTEQRAALAANILAYQKTLKEKSENEEPANLPVAKTPPMKQKDVAESLNVSERSVRDAQKVKEQDPEAFREIEQGKKSVNAAVKDIKEKNKVTAKPIPETVIQNKEKIQPPEYDDFNLVEESLIASAKEFEEQLDRYYNIVDRKHYENFCNKLSDIIFGFELKITTNK
jgi:ParB-like chromosome segregation protein Spo0J